MRVYCIEQFNSLTNIISFYMCIGIQRRTVSCKEQEDGQVDDRFCDADTKPDDRVKSCNVHKCPAR